MTRRAKLIVVSLSIVLFLLALVLVAYFLWSLDAAPVPSEPTLADLKSAPAEYSQTYELLVSLKPVLVRPDPCEQTASDMTESIEQLLPQILENLKTMNWPEEELTPEEALMQLASGQDYADASSHLAEHEDAFDKMWAAAEENYQVIRSMAEFEEIADLTEPNIDSIRKAPYVDAFKDMGCLYRLRVLKRLGTAHYDEALSDFALFHEVVRKLSVNARPVLTKSTCYQILRDDILFANWLVNNVESHDAGHAVWDSAFRSLTNSEISGRNAVLFEYLIVRKELDRLGPSQTGYKRNSTIRLLRHSFALEKDVNTVWPEVYPRNMTVLNAYGEPSCSYMYYNPIGVFYWSIAVPLFGRINQQRLELAASDEMFQIVLANLKGAEYDMSSSVFADKYVIDIERECLFSVGPDGDPNTEDDIKLVINTSLFVPAE
jgi:hypothetical protein